MLDHRKYSKTTKELRDYLKMTARPAQVEELVAVLDDLEYAERRIAAALTSLKIKVLLSPYAINTKDVEILQGLLEGRTVAKTVSKDDDTKGFEGVTQ